MIDVTAWALTRQAAIEFLESINVARLDLATGDIVPVAECHIHPCRANESIAVITTPAVRDANGAVVTPAEVAPGFHFNLRFYGSSAATLTQGLPQVDGDGKQLGLFERTHILDLVQMRSGTAPAWQATSAPVPAGYETPDGVRAFDPDTIKTRRNVFA